MREYKPLIVAILLIAIISAIIFTQSGITPTTPQMTGAVRGYHLLDETSLFKTVYQAGDTITVGGGTLINDNTSHDFPSRYWYNVWYKATGETTWICIYGNEDEETRPFKKECSCKGWNIQDGRDFPIYYTISGPKYKTFPFNLQTINVVTDEYFDGDLRIDFRFQLIPVDYAIFLYQEFTVGSDTATIKSTHTVENITVEPEPPWGEETSAWVYYGIPPPDEATKEDITAFLNCNCIYKTFHGAFMSQYLKLFENQSACEQSLAEEKQQYAVEKYSQEHKVPGYETLTFFVALGIATLILLFTRRRKV